MLDRRFDEFLRRGGETPQFEAPPTERKFNPNHDPDDGRFTFATGHGTLAPRAGSADSAGMMNRVRIPQTSPGRPPIERRPAAATPKTADLGALSARYESSSRSNPGLVSTGKGDEGGPSYGTHQLASRTGSVAAFLASPEGQHWSREFTGLAPGSSAFSKKWRTVAARDPRAFDEAQNLYVGRTHYDGAARLIVKRTHLDIGGRSEAVGQVTYSTAIQHGPSGGAAIVTKAILQTDSQYARTDPRYESRLINEIYDIRTAFWIAKREAQLNLKQKERANTSNNVATIRLPEERSIALRLLRGK